MSIAPDTLYPTNNIYGIPTLLIDLCADAVDAPFCAWGSISRRRRMPGTWHFYTDDYRFSALWKRPEDLPSTACNTAVEPNLTLSDQMPLAIVLERIYRKRWIARYWQQQNIRVLVDLNVPPNTRTYNLLGVPVGWSAYATRGYSRRIEHIDNEYQTALEHARKPPLFVVYGGGQRVQRHCMERGYLYYAEHQDARRRAHG